MSGNATAVVGCAVSVEWAWMGENAVTADHKCSSHERVYNRMPCGDEQWYLIAPIVC